MGSHGHMIEHSSAIGSQPRIRCARDNLPQLARPIGLLLAHVEMGIVARLWQAGSSNREPEKSFLSNRRFELSLFRCRLS